MRFLRRLFRGLVAACVASAAIAIVYVAMAVHDGYDFVLDQPAHGSVLGEVDGVAVYAGDGYDVRGAYGKEFQCVELVNRVLVEKHGFRNLTQTGHADTYYWEAVEKGLSAYQNGGSEPPRAWDVLVFDGGENDGSVGHVAIVTAVSEGTVEFIEQNFQTCRLGGLFCRSIWFDSLPLVHEQGMWRVAQGKYPYPVAGWTRPKESR